MVLEVDKLVAELRFMNVVLPDIYERIKIVSDHIVAINFDSTHFANFSHFPVSIARLPQLRYLSLRYNHLEELPPELLQINSLRSLDLGHNHIQTVPKEIAELDKLEKLRLNHNEITQVNDIPHNLQRLNLSNNQISEPLFNTAMSTLHSLSLANNRISNISSHDMPQSLRYLNLRSNRLTTLPESLFHDQLAKLNVYNNPIDWSTVTMPSVPDYIFVDHLNDTVLESVRVLYPRFKDYRFIPSHPPEFGVSYQGIPFTSIMIYGVSGMGKQELIETFLYDRFVPDSTLLVSQNRYLNWDHYLFQYNDVYYQVWYPFSQDLSDPTYRTSVLNGFYYTGAVILIFSYDDETSFKTVIQSIQQIYEIRQDSCTVITVATGTPNRTLTYSRVRSILDNIEANTKISIPLIEISDDSESIDPVFNILFEMLNR